MDTIGQMAKRQFMKNQLKSFGMSLTKVKTQSRDMTKREVKQLITLLSKVRDTDHHKVGAVIAFLLQGDFVCDLDHREVIKTLLEP